MYAFSAARARAWFWALVAVAVLSMGALSWAISAAPGPWPASALLASGSVLLGSTVQATRLLLALKGPPRPFANTPSRPRTSWRIP